MPTKVERLVAVVLSAHERWRRWMSRPVLRAAVFAFVIVASVLVVVHPALAQASVDNPGALDRFMLFLAGAVLALAQALGQLVVAVIDFIIPLMTYQNIVNSPVVNAGWAIVRDTVNMFFVIVLIVIAMGTIFGSQRFHWEQQVPRLLGFAILINFSKTLCGIMIDFGQIIMLTFANALKDIAAGNFIQLLGLIEIMSISDQATVIKDSLSPGGRAPAPFDYLTASIAAVFMMIIVLATLIILGVILAFRIVMLWILVTLAPLAWFVGGVKDVVRSNAYSEWWSNFTCYVAIGPVLTFFLWLTLAVAGSGNIAANAGFTAGVPSPSGNNADILSKIFEFQNLTSFVIGIAMLYAGFDAAQKVCSGAKGIASSAIGAARGVGRGVARRAAGLGAYAGAKGARLGLRGARYVGGEAVGLAAGTLKTAPGPLPLLTKEGRAKFARDTAKTTTSPMAARILGTYADTAEKEISEKVKKAGEPYEKASKDTKLATLDAMARGSKPSLPSSKKEAMALFGEMLGDAKSREKLEKSGSLKTLYGWFGEDMESAFKGDKTLSESLKGFKAARPDMALKEGSLDYSESLKEVDDIKAIDFTFLKDMAPEKSKALLDYLDTFETGKDKDGNTTFASGDLAAGKFGRQKAEAYKDFMKTLRPPAMDLMSGFDAAKGEFANEKVEEQFASAMRDSLDQLGGIDEASINAKDGNNAIVSSVASGLNQDRLQGLVKRFKKANDEEKRAMLPLMKKVNTIVGKADEFNPTKQTEQQKKYFEKQYKSLVEPFEASAGVAPGATAATIDTMRTQLAFNENNIGQTRAVMAEFEKLMANDERKLNEALRNNDRVASDAAANAVRLTQGKIMERQQAINILEAENERLRRSIG